MLMKLNGWLRIWILLTCIYGLIVAVVAYSERPKLEQLQYNWVRDAADLIAERLSQKSGKEVHGYYVRERMNKNKNDLQVIQYLEKLAQEPTDAQRPYAEDVGRLNQKHMALVADFPKTIFLHIMAAIAWWLGPALVLLTFGWSVGWVIRGFRVK